MVVKLPMTLDANAARWMEMKLNLMLANADLCEVMAQKAVERKV